MLGLLLPFAAPAHAQSQEVIVRRRDGNIRVQTNGDVRVEETWQVQFVGGPFRFAFRSIPLNRVNAIDEWAVSENGQAYQQGSSEQPGTFTLADENSERKITWYFPSTTEETRTFVLGYTLRGALRIDPEGDQFFWKFIEDDRGYTIDASRVVLQLPATIPSADLLSTTYLNGDETGNARTVDGSTIEFNGGPFAPGDEWEIRTQFPNGIVQASAPGWQTLQDRQPIFNLVALVVTLLVLVGGSLGLYMLWYMHGRDTRVALNAEFYPRPPDDLAPGIAGTLLDERADMREILGTMVDLARRGFIQIVELDDSTGSRGFRFVRLRGDDGTLRPYERKLFDKIFGQRTERDLSDLREKFYKVLPEIKDDLYDETVKAGLFDAHPQRTRTTYAVAGVAIAVLAGFAGFFGYAFIAEYAPLAILVVFATVFVGIAFAVLGRFMPRKTTKGATAAMKWGAFKRYLARVDQYTEVDQAKEQFEQYLPYAIAFGLEREWVRTFSTVNTPAPVWYHPYPYYPTYVGAGGGSRQSSGDSIGSGAGSGGGGLPSLDGMAGGAFSGLESMSTGLFSMLDSTASIFTSVPASSSSGGGGGSSGFG